MTVGLLPLAGCAKRRKESKMVTDRFFFFASFRIAVAAFAVSALTLGASAQRADSQPVDAKAIIRIAYAKTKTAKTQEEITEIIELCHRAQKSGLSPDLTDYIQDLLAWAHNRRGEVYADRGASLAENGQSDEATKVDAMAMKEFETAIQLDPDYWKAIHNRGVNYALVGKFEEAVQDFSRALELKPEYANAWFNRGEIQYELGKFAEAVSDYSQAIRLKPDDNDAFVRRGHTHFQLRHLREALADYNRAVELAPNDAEALTNRGDAYRCLGQWQEAATDYRKAIALEESSGRAYHCAAWLMATCPDDQYRNGQLAIQAAEKAIELDGRDDFAYLDTLAAAYANAGQFDKAQKAIAEAIPIAAEGHVKPLEQRLELYQQNRPYRESAQVAGRSEPGAVR